MIWCNTKPSAEGRYWMRYTCDGTTRETIATVRKHFSGMLIHVDGGWNSLDRFCDGLNADNLQFSSMPIAGPSEIAHVQAKVEELQRHRAQMKQHGIDLSARSQVLLEDLEQLLEGSSPECVSLHRSDVLQRDALSWEPSVADVVERLSRTGDKQAVTVIRMLQDLLYYNSHSSDSYGVHGSHFDICTLCGSEGNPGLRANGIDHDPKCPCYGSSSQRVALPCDEERRATESWVIAFDEQCRTFEASHDPRLVIDACAIKRYARALAVELAAHMDVPYSVVRDRLMELKLWR